VVIKDLVTYSTEVSEIIRLNLSEQVKGKAVLVLE